MNPIAPNSSPSNNRNHGPDPDVTIEFPAIREPFPEEKPAKLTEAQRLQRDLGPDALQLDEEGLALRRRLVAEEPLADALAYAPDTTLRASQISATPADFARDYPEETKALLPPVGPPQEQPRSPKEFAQDVGAGAAAAARRVMSLPGEAVRATKEAPGKIAEWGTALRENTASLFKERAPLKPVTRRLTAVALGASVLFGGLAASQINFEGQPTPPAAVAIAPPAEKGNHPPVREEVEDPALRGTIETPAPTPTGVHNPNNQEPQKQTPKTHAPKKQAPEVPETHEPSQPPKRDEPPKSEPSPEPSNPPSPETPPTPTPPANQNPESPQPPLDDGGQQTGPDAGAQNRTLT